MKKHSLISKFLACAICAMLLIAPLGTIALAAETGESDSDPIVISRMPYTDTRSFYQVDTGETKTETTTGEDGETITTEVPVYEDHFDFYYKYTATSGGRLTVEVSSDSEITCYAAVYVNDVSVGSANSGVGLSAKVDLQDGDVVTIQFSSMGVTNGTIKVNLTDYPAGSQYNPKQIEFADIKNGLAVELAKGDCIFYTWTAPETGVIKFTTSDIYASGDGALSSSMPFQQQIYFNGDSLNLVYSSFVSYYKLTVNAGDTISMAVECPSYAVAGGYTLHAEYVPPFVLDAASQQVMFNGYYDVVGTSSMDGSLTRFFAVEFNWEKKTVSALDMKNDVLLGTYTFTYNTENGDLTLTDSKGKEAPYAIKVVEDETAPMGAYLKLYYNGGYRLTACDAITEPGEAVKQLLTGRYERWSFGTMRETFVFDYANSTVVIAKDWESEGITYTMSSYSIFTGELVLTAEGKDDITLIAIGGVIKKGNYELVPVEEPHVHSYTSVDTAPTCTEAGYTTFTCECGETYTEEGAPALGHSYQSVVTAPTCTEGGYTTNTCSVCGDVTVTDETTALGHSYQSVVTAPTCTEGGYTTHTCATCGDMYTDAQTAATGHKYETVVTAPTCTQQGYTTYTCACGDSYVDSYQPATGHSYGQWQEEKSPTCTAEGQQRRECANCDSVETKSIAATGHSWDDGVVIKEPTESSKGEKEFTCTVCGEKKTESIPELGHTHSYTDTVTAPTCTEKGYTTHTCACGDSYVDSYVDALGHKYEAVVTAATCTEQGYTTHTCAACGDSYVDTYTAALGHKWGEGVVTAPTCTQEGFTTYQCSVCANTYTDSKVSATGHKYSQSVTAPTCTEDGYTTHTCANCGDAYQDSKVPATDHSWDNGVEANGQLTYTCTVCGSSYSVEVSTNAFAVPGNLTGTFEGTKEFSWVATEDGYLVIENVSALSGAYLTVTINGAEVYPTEYGFPVSEEDLVVISVLTHSMIEINIPVYMYEDQQQQPDSGAMEFDVAFNGWNIYEQTWVAPFSGTVTFVITESNVSASDLTFRVIDAAGQFYNQYEFGLDENGNQFVSLDVTEGDVLTIVAYEDTMKVEGKLHISVLEGAPALHEHTYDEGVVMAPTCTTDGYTTYTCTGCGESYNADTVKASHSYEGVVTEPTCTEDGYTTYTCSVCGDSYVENGDKALGHSYGDWEVVKEATTTETGSKKRTCGTCGEEETEEIPMIEQTPTTVPATQPATQPTTTAPATEPATTGGDNTVQQDEGPGMFLIIVIVAVVLIAGVVAVVIVIKKKK